MSKKKNPEDFEQVGRPPTFDDPKELQGMIDDYFQTGVRQRKILVGKFPNQTSMLIEVPTISGLCYYLGFESRQSFYDYEKKPEFAYIIKKARLFIEIEYEEHLTQGNTIGAIFALKNMGWRDRTEIAPVDPDGNALTQPMININVVQPEKPEDT